MKLMRTIGWLATACMATLTGCAVQTESTTAEPTSSSAEAMSIASRPPVNPCAGGYTYLLRLPDNDGAKYWANYRMPTASPDGFTVPFPTPWITNNANNIPAKTGLVYEPDVYSYEQDQWDLPSSQDYQYLVQIVYGTTCTNVATGGQGVCFDGFAANKNGASDAEFFAVPFSSLSDITQARAYANQYVSDPNVQAQIIECVQFVDGTATKGSPLRIVETDIFADVHDPHNPPN